MLPLFSPLFWLSLGLAMWSDTLRVLAPPVYGTVIPFPRQFRPH